MTTSSISSSASSTRSPSSSLLSVHLPLHKSSSATSCDSAVTTSSPTTTTSPSSPTSTTPTNPHQHHHYPCGVLTHRLHACDLLMSVLERYLTHILLQPIITISPTVTPTSSTTTTSITRTSSTSSTNTNNTANNNSIFHAVHPPHISALDYFRRLVRYAFCSRSVFVAALYHIRTLARRGIVSVNILSIHRLLVTAVVVAVKSLDDVLYDNAHFAKVGGLDLQELNVLELDMLKALDFRAGVDVDEYRRFEQCLLAAAFWNGGYNVEEEEERKRKDKFDTNHSNKKQEEEREDEKLLGERLRAKGFERVMCDKKKCCGLCEKIEENEALVQLRKHHVNNIDSYVNSMSEHDDDDDEHLSVSDSDDDDDDEDDDDDDDDDESAPMECTANSKRHQRARQEHAARGDAEEDEEEPGSPTSSMDVSFGAD